MTHIEPAAPAASTGPAPGAGTLQAIRRAINL
jgi:hypothetical protein